MPLEKALITVIKAFQSEFWQVNAGSSYRMWVNWSSGTGGENLWTERALSRGVTEHELQRRAANELRAGDLDLPALDFLIQGSSCG